MVLRFTDKSNYETIGFVEEMKNRDPRLTQTIRAAGYVRDDGKKYLPNFKLAKIRVSSEEVRLWS